MFKLIIYEKDKNPIYDDCPTYLLIKIGNFKIHWFKDCGDWFIYCGWFGEKQRGFRLSSAGNMILK